MDLAVRLLGSVRLPMCVIFIQEEMCEYFRMPNSEKLKAWSFIVTSFWLKFKECDVSRKRRGHTLISFHFSNDFGGKCAQSQRRVLRLFFFVIQHLEWSWGDVGWTRMPVWYFSTAGASPPSLLPSLRSSSSFTSSPSWSEVTWLKRRAERRAPAHCNIDYSKGGSVNARG